MANPLHIQPISAFGATVTPPGSKSLTNRALLLAALADGESIIRNPLIAEDTQLMLDALCALGFDVQHDAAANTVRVRGLGGQLPAKSADLNLGNAGTTYRFLTAACCLGAPGNAYTLDGNKRMRQRPIRQLVEPLRELGAQIEYLNDEGFPPLRVVGCQLSGKELNMPPTLSSQYISALLHVAPYCRDDLTIHFDGPVTSRPYVQMTLGLMSVFGVDAEVDPALTRIHIEPGRYTAADYTVEPDASNASYFLAAAAIIPESRCTIDGLGKGSLQGDVGFADVLHQMGADIVYGREFITVKAPPKGQRLRGIDVDLNQMPDMAQTLAAAALFADGPTTIRNVGNLRVKETDRLAALQNELNKLGAVVTIDGDDLTIEPPPGGKIKPAAIDTYDDHRMAMSFAVVGLAAPGVVINDPGCVAKTFPRFFEYLGRLGHERGPD
ncbi:MAG: 3-phosphoshikimate 1-carboxyvinyltransferase [Phycisphaeraceae bacterium]